MGKKSTKIDLTGQPYGRWLVLEEAGHDKNGHDFWRCRCSCGTERVVLGSSLRNEKSKSCGCLSRERTVERITTHGLSKSNPRLYKSVYAHFSKIREGAKGYRNWTLDPRYPDSAEGVVMFCMDVITSQPEACALYEIDKSLDLDKDNNADRIFRPESIVFRPSLENRSKQHNNLKLEDGRSLSEFCREVGIKTCENGKVSKQYDIIRLTFSRGGGKIHPELLQKANDYLTLLRKLKASLDLLAEVREFANGLSHIYSTKRNDVGQGSVQTLRRRLSFR